MEPNTPAKKKNDEISLKEVVLSIQDWVKYLCSRWKVLLIALVAGALVGAAYSFFSPKKYVAKSTFVLDEANQNSAFSALTGGVSSLIGGNSDNGDLFSGDNLIWLYASNRMVGEALLTPVKNDSGKQITLVNWLIRIDGEMQTVVKKIKQRDKTFQGFPDTLIARNRLSLYQSAVLNAAIGRVTKEYLTVAQEQNTTGVIGVSISSEDELFSLNIVNALVSHVNAFYIKTQTQQAQEQVTVLQQKVDEFNRSMNSSMYQAASAAQSIPFANPNLPTLDVAPQRKYVDVKVSSAIYVSMVQQLEAAKLTLADETPLIQIVDAPERPLPINKPGLIMFTIIGVFLFIFLTTIFLIIKESYRKLILGNSDLDND